MSQKRLLTVGIAGRIPQQVLSVKQLSRAEYLMYQRFSKLLTKRFGLGAANGVVLELLTIARIARADSQQEG